MKQYEILDQETNDSVGCLLYFEKEKSFVIELNDHLNEWTAPLLFAKLVKEERYTMTRELSGLWVKERVIPSGRQNIGAILSHAQMKEYDEMTLLERSRARSSQDSLEICSIPTIPSYVMQRMKHNLVDCVMCDDFFILCFFQDESVRKVDLSKLLDVPDVSKIISNESLFRSGCIAAGGYCVTFNNAIDLSAELLYHSGTLIPLSMNDFLCFVQNNVMDTSESCTILECSRQNLSYLISKNILTPIKKDVKGNLFAKGDVLRGRW